MTDTPSELSIDSPQTQPAPGPNHRQGLLRRTINEGLILFVLSALVGTILQALHMGVFLAGEQNTKAISAVLKLNPLLLIAAGLIAAPILEELLFRGLPFWLYRRFAPLRKMTTQASLQVSWIVGGIAAILFAVAHGTGSLPIPQLMVGLWSWHVINTRGLRYSMALHASYNFVPILLLCASSYLPPSYLPTPQ